MKRIFIVFLAATMFSCVKGNDETTPGGKVDPQDEVTLKMNFNVGESVIVTRSIGENDISKLNVLLYSPSGELCYYSQAESNSLTLKVIPSTYTLYAVANYDINPSDCMDEQVIKGLIYSFQSDNLSDVEGLPIVHAGQVEVPMGQATVTIPDISLERSYAKIRFNVELAPAVASGAEILSVEACKIPAYCCMVAEPGWRTSVFFSSADVSAENNAKQCSGYFYMPENQQGIKSGITTQADRNPSKAPYNASYLTVSVRFDDGVAQYIIYLGGNDTDNFDVIRNMDHSYNITITGRTKSDFRVRQHTIEIPAKQHNRYLQGNGTFWQQINCFNSVKSDPFSVKVECLSGDWQYVTLERIQNSTGQATFENGVCNFGKLLNNTQSGGFVTYIYVRYTPPRFSAKNSTLKLKYTFTDTFGNEFVSVTSYNYANCVKIISMLDYVQYNYGTINFEQFLEIGHVPTAQDAYSMLLTIDDPIAARLVPFSRYKFIGWYKDKELTDFFSSEAHLSFVPQTLFVELFPKFELE